MEHNKDNHSHSHHLVPLRVYYLTLAALLVLTVITVGVSYVDFGSTANVVVSLSIASAKASLVLLFFMGLKYDTNLNRAYILGSFAALVLMISVSAADLWTRPQHTPVTVKPSSGPLSTEEFQALMAGGSELLDHGKSVYDVNCAVCHGASGQGDGIGGGALNPKPRDFTTPGSQWTNGNTLQAIYVTLHDGVPNTGMAPYQALPVRDRVALAHYVQSLSKGAAEASKVTEAKFTEVVQADGIGGEGSGAGKRTLPIDFALERMVQ